MDENTTTISVKRADGTMSEPVDLEDFHKAVGQLTLSDAIFPATRAKDVPMVKVSLSGTIEMPVTRLLELLDGETVLDAGDVVLVAASGFVVQPGSAWVRRVERDPVTKDATEWWEKEGRIKVKVTDLARIERNGETWSE